MIRTGRFTLGLTPVIVDEASDNDIPGRSLSVVPQANGVIVICEDEDSYATGARVTVSLGQILEFNSGFGREDVWLASPAALDVDIIQTGVA